MQITISAMDNRGIKMDAMDRVLGELKATRGVNGVLLVSTSGAHIYGDAPANAHMETFTTMSAILLGAAETATKELRDKLRHVAVELDRSSLIIHPVGPTALLVLSVEKGNDISEIVKRSTEVGSRVAQLL